MTQSLDDILVLDFSTFLPGPMATLIPAEAAVREALGVMENATTPLARLR